MCTRSTNTKPLKPTVPPSLAGSAYWGIKAAVVNQMLKVGVPPSLPYWKWPDTTQTNVIHPIEPPRLASEQMGLTRLPRPMLLQPPCRNPASTDCTITLPQPMLLQPPCLNQCASLPLLHLKYVCMYECNVCSMYVGMYVMYVTYVM